MKKFLIKWLYNFLHAFLICVFAMRGEWDKKERKFIYYDIIRWSPTGWVTIIVLVLISGLIGFVYGMKQAGDQLDLWK